MSADGERSVPDTSGHTGDIWAFLWLSGLRFRLGCELRKEVSAQRWERDVASAEGWLEPHRVGARGPRGPSRLQPGFPP